MSPASVQDAVQVVRQRHIALLVALQALLATVVVAGTLMGLRDMREEALQGHLHQASLQVRGFEDHLSQNLHLVSLMLSSLPELLADPQLAKAGNHNLLLESIQRQMPALRSLSLADADGRILVSSSAANVGVRVDFSAYLPPMDERRDGVMRFGAPREGRDFHASRETNPAAPVGARANYLLPAMQYLPGPAGLIAVAAINPDYFANHIGGYIDAGLGHVALFDYNGVTALTTWDGHHAGNLIDDERVLGLARNAEIGAIPDDVAHGRATLTVYRALRNAPFFVVAHIDRQAALAKWEKEAIARILMVALALAATLLVTGLLTLRLRTLFAREVRLQEAQRLAASVFAQSNDGILVVDAETHILAVNPAFEAITGFTAADAIGNTPRILSSGRHPRDFYTDMWQQIKATGGWRGEIVNRHKDGSEVTEWLTISSIHDAAGTVSNYVGVFKDVSTLRESERTIRQLTMAVEQSPSSIVITTPEPAIAYVNPHFTAVTGYLPEEVIGQNPRMLQSKLTPAETYEAMWSRLLVGKNWEGEFINRRKDGSLYYEHATVAPVKDQRGNIINFVAIKYDITERKQLERNLLLAKEAAEAANVAKSRFLATMSHEIRTPMNGVLGMAQLLLAGPASVAETKDYARTILHSGQTLLALLNDILDLSKIEAGKLALSAGTVTPGEIARETAHLFAENAQGKGLALHSDWRGPAGGRYRGDAHRLRQMLSNLVNNAIKFTPAGEVRIEAAELARDEQSALLEFAVIDTGIGIAAAQCERLFKPFSQIDDSATRQFGGTGLGLAIVRQLALLMDGEAGVDSTPGQGSRFWFRVRLAMLPANEDSRAAPREEVAAAAPHLSGRVLVVEDNPTNRLVIEAILRKMGLDVLIAENGQEAVERVMAEAGGIDAILMDVQMPVLDGYRATARIRAWERQHGHTPLPIIALTADAFAEDRARCLAAGMDDYLAKPVDFEKLAILLAKRLPTIPTAPQDIRPATAAGALDEAACKAQIAALLPLLEKSRFEAIDSFARLEALAAGSPLADALAALRPQLQAFRFAPVHAALLRWLTTQAQKGDSV
jgi:PAS domain S-box-containing protein